MFKNIIVVVGMPRSGTSWLSQILDSSPQTRFKLSPIFSYAFKNAVNENSTKQEFEKLFEGAYFTADEFMDQLKKRNNGEYPSFENKEENPKYFVIKMTRFHNLLEKMLDLFDNLKIVSIVRNPCGAIHSWLTTPGEFPAEADPNKEWRSGECRKTGPEEFWGFDDWKKVTKLHLHLKKKYADQFYILQYEDLVDDVFTETDKLFRFLGLPLEKQTRDFLVHSQSNHSQGSYAVFKKPAVKSRWETEMQPEFRDAIVNEIQSTELEVFLR